ncbi:extracellular solute-binding protein [Cryobacterium sp. TMT4-31]|uniref:extracellular solute-binding protein n=1 Tax=Cryobacterium sp. TMT4-31 TaxID=1259259 RepID=UPI00141BDC7D|nr:extracellular solute-binding protein [Cryobacterium sp. TMT4-31]
MADVTDAQLKGATIEMARFFGDCSDDIGTSTDLSAAVGECATIQTLTNKFNAENEWGITVDRLGGAAWDSYYDTLNSAFAGGNPPDVAIMHGSSLVDYANRGLLLPIDDLVDVADIDLADAVPAAKTAISYDGTNYAVPFDVHAALAHLNVDLFTAAGLVNADGTPKLPTSTEEFLADAKTLEDKTGKKYFAVATSGDALGVHVFESLLDQQGSGVLNEDGTQANIDTPEAIESLGFMNEVFSAGYAEENKTYDAAQESFLKGDAAMLFNGTWVVDQYNGTAPFTYEATNFPTLYEEPGVWADSHTWTIPVQKDADPVKYRAALEFISFLYEHDADWALGTGHISARESVLNSDAYKAAPQRASYADTGLTVAHPVPHIASWPAVSKALIGSVESVWFQGEDVDKALKDGSSSIDSVLGGK